MTLARILKIESEIAHIGWHIIEPTKKLEILDEKIIWEINYRHSNKNAKLIFQLIDDFGRRTKNLKNLFLFKIDGYDQEFYFKKINSTEWYSTLNQFRKHLSLIVTV